VSVNNKLMAHALIVRGFDDQVHEKLGEMANQRGVSINSIVKDAVDIWIKKQLSDAPKKHHLLIYSDNESMMRMLKSMDRLAKQGNYFRCFFGPPHSPATELLSKLDWYDGTGKPYPYSSEEGSQRMQQAVPVQTRKNIMAYCNKILENVMKRTGNKQVCCIDFMINDVGKTSLTSALDIEKHYDDNRLGGLMYCIYKTNNILNSDIKDLIELFEMHDQIFILNEDDVYKLHLTKENVHKLFLG
jgi:hypothetical protein